jgi:hypothetical protein
MCTSIRVCACVLDAVLQEMDKTGCDFFVDVHGDEALPYCFLSGMDGCTVWGERLERLQTTFACAYQQVTLRGQYMSYL